MNNGFINSTSIIKISKKRGRGLMPYKGGKQEVTEIDDIIHNSSYCQSDSAFLTEFGGL